MNRITRWVSRVWNALNVNFMEEGEVRRALAGTSSTKVGDGRKSNVIMAPIQFIQRASAQAEPVLEERTGRLWRYTEGPDGGPEMIDLLNEPNPYYDGGSLMDALRLSWFIDGNAYLLKVRNPLRAVRELWYVPHWMMDPKWPEDGSQFISHYQYTPLRWKEPQQVRPSDVVHLRVGLDPDNTRKGLSPIKHVLREVMTDEEASEFSAYILHNMGVPGGVIAPKDASAVPKQEDVEAMKSFMKEGFSGKNRGEWLALGTPTEVHQFGFDPNRLMLGPLRDISEERVTSALGIPAAVVGFGAGLQQTKVGATMRELVRLARVNCIEPNDAKIARQLTRQLLPEFVADPSGLRLTFDYSNVPLFAEDEKDRADRAKTLVEGSVMMVSEAREMVGLPADETQRVYLRPNT
ncbi:MAG TPA: phage portal protein, partial [Longimicrobiales bacterium]|nr:phage portal protein [Longimicrobiales bacterium]